MSYEMKRFTVLGLAKCMKENLVEMLEAEEELPRAFAIKFNKILLENSGYGFREEDWHYFKPSTREAIKAIRDIFGLGKTENVLVIPSAALGSFLEEYRSIPVNRRWRMAGRAKASLYPRYL